MVSGYFDPLIASHAHRLAGLKRDGAPLLVLIATPSDPILPASARAELVASLGVVNYVTVVDHVMELAGGLAAQVRLEQEDNVRLEKLIQQVHSRQRAAS